MEEVKQTGDYKIFKKRNGRFGVKAKDGKWVNGMAKAEILSSEGLIKWTKPKNPPPEAPAAEAAPAEDAPPAEETAPTEEKTEAAPAEEKAE